MGWYIISSSLLNMASKHDAICTNPSQCRSRLFVTGEIDSRMASSPLHSLNWISPFGSMKGRFVDIHRYQLVSALLHYGEPFPLGALWNLFSHALKCQLCLFFFCTSSCSSVLVSGRTAHKTIQTSHLTVQCRILGFLPCLICWKMFLVSVPL